MQEGGTIKAAPRVHERAKFSAPPQDMVQAMDVHAGKLIREFVAGPTSRSASAQL